MYLSGKAVSSEGMESTVILRIWAELFKEMRLEPRLTRMIIVNLE